MMKEIIIEAVTTEERTIPLKCKLDSMDNDESYFFIGILPATQMKINESIKELTIPSTAEYEGETYRIKGIGSDVFWLQSFAAVSIGTCFNPIKKLVIDDNISIINSSAFKGVYIDTVVWPASAETVDDYTFVDAKIQNFEGMENVTKIGIGAFKGNSALSSFNWPKGCDVIPEKCFSQDKNLSEINISAPIVQIERYAFWGTALSEIDLSDSFTCYIFDSAQEGGIKFKMSFYA
jgi:hypothetical protein